ncbi:MAG: hypothetical protein H6Q33_259 [Deltaproteobacteria bacterium]|nr:hypothetical protein [Deltaproteobacteria bacterium]
MHKTTNTVGGGQVGAVAFRKAGLITIGLLVGAMGCATMSQSGSGGAPVEKYSATVQVGSGAGQGNVPVIITIRSYTSDAEAAQLVQTLRTQGPDGLVDVMRKLDGKGNFAPAMAMSQELKVIRAVKTPNGRQLRMLLDRPIGFLEGRIGARTLTYQVGIIVINLDANGKGDGQMIVAARPSFDKNNELVIEKFDFDPVLVKDVAPLAN